MSSNTRAVSPPPGQHGTLQGDLRTANGDEYPCGEKLGVVTLHTTYRGTTQRHQRTRSICCITNSSIFLCSPPEDQTRQERNVEIMYISVQSPAKAEHKHLARINAHSFKRTTFHYKFSAWLLLRELNKQFYMRCCLYNWMCISQTSKWSEHSSRGLPIHFTSD